jgi:hypothetical protein
VDEIAIRCIASQLKSSAWKAKVHEIAIRCNVSQLRKSLQHLEICRHAHWATVRQLDGWAGHSVNRLGKTLSEQLPRTPWAWSCMLVLICIQRSCKT